MVLGRYTHYDGYPDGLGVSFASEVPPNPAKYTAWLENQRAYHQQMLDEEGLDDTKPQGFRNLEDDDDDARCWVQRGPPEQHTEWMYTINLDHLVFQVNDMPIFRLDNMPHGETFVAGIGLNAYGHQAPTRYIPAEYWAALRCTRMPVPPQEDLLFHREYKAVQCVLPVHELLMVPQKLHEREKARQALLAALVGQYHETHLSADTTPWLATHGIRTEVPNTTATAIQQLISLALSYQVVATGESHAFEIDKPFDLNWFRADMFGYVATQLQEDKQLQATISQVVRLVRQSKKRGSVFGVLCSFLHVVILRISTGPDMKSTTFSHTAPLQFCPDAYPAFACTPGIAALARLSTAPDLSFMVRKPENLANYPVPSTAPSLDQRCPMELWISIARHLFQGKDLVALGCTSRQCQAAVAEVLRDLSFPGLRVTRYRPFNWNAPPPPPTAFDKRHGRDFHLWTGSPDADDESGFVHPRLYHAAFDVVDERGVSRIVHVTGGRYRPIWRLLRELHFHGYWTGDSECEGTDLGPALGGAHPCYFIQMVDK